MKSLVGMAVLAIAAQIVTVNYIQTISTSAVVTTVRTNISAPIPGIIEYPQRAVGQIVGQGESLAGIKNELVDDSTVHELQQKLSVTRAERATLLTLRDRLEDVRKRLAKGESSYQSRRVDQLGELLLQSRAKAEEERAKLEQASARLARAQQLQHEGLMSEQDVGDARRDKLVGDQSLQEAEAGLRALTTSLDSTRSGINLDTTTDKPYSRQRLDELEVKLVEVASEISQREQRATALAAQLEVETTRLSARSQAHLASPFRGRIWQIFVGSGEYVNQGKELFALADCSHLLVNAWVNERNYQRLRVGTAATFSVLDSKESYAATVVQLLGRFEKRQDIVLGQVQDISSDAVQQFAVTLSVPELAHAQAGSCEFGQLGEVHFHVSAFSR